jgi:hypothetical protein
MLFTPLFAVRGLSRTSYHARMARLIQGRRENGSDGWEAWYNVVRDDGGQVFVEVSCTETAYEAVRTSANEAARRALADQGTALALELAESAQAARGTCYVTVTFDSLDGGIRHDYRYDGP